MEKRRAYVTETDMCWDLEHPQVLKGGVAGHDFAPAERALLLSAGAGAAGAAATVPCSSCCGVDELALVLG